MSPEQEAELRKKMAEARQEADGDYSGMSDATNERLRTRYGHEQYGDPGDQMRRIAPSPQTHPSFPAPTRGPVNSMSTPGESVDIDEPVQAPSYGDLVKRSLLERYAGQRGPSEQEMEMAHLAFVQNHPEVSKYINGVNSAMEGAREKYPPLERSISQRSVETAPRPFMGALNKYKGYVEGFTKAGSNRQHNASNEASLSKADEQAKKMERDASLAITKLRGADRDQAVKEGRRGYRVERATYSK